MRNSNTIAIDLAKDVFQVCTMSSANKINDNFKVNRKKLSEYIAKQEQSVVVMEACYSSHYWARTFHSMGHEVRLIPAQHVKPFVRGNKNDKNDAIAIAEASLRPDLKYVPVKTVEQQDIQSIHRIRDRLVAQRTGLINQTRGLLSEYGIVFPQGIEQFRKFLHQAADANSTQITPLMFEQLRHVDREFTYLSLRLAELNKQLKTIATQNPLCSLLTTLPGIGVINATALYSAVGNGSQFNNPREMAVWLGLTPSQYASGNKSHTGSITKRGNRYLRKQLIHGARAAIFRYKATDDKLTRWITNIVQRRGVNKAAVALAHRLVRLAWLILQRQEPYRSQPA